MGFLASVHLYNLSYPSSTMIYILTSPNTVSVLPANMSTIHCWRGILSSCIWRLLVYNIDNEILIKSRNSRVPNEHVLDLQCHIQYLLFSSPRCFLWSPLVKHRADIHGRKAETNFECSWQIHWKHILLFWNYITWIDRHIIYII